MKGSDKWGQGGGPRIRLELVVAVLLVATAAGAYYFYSQGNPLTSVGQKEGIATVSTTGVQCNDDSMPGVAQDVQQSQDFLQLSGGLCYNYNGMGPAGAGAGVTEYYFNHYNGSVAYPCGTAPQALVDSQIVALADSNGTLVSVRFANDSALNPAPACGPAPPVGVESMTDVGSTIPAVRELNLTLFADPAGRPIANLTARLTLDGGVQTFLFGVTPSSKLQPGQSASSMQILLGGVTFSLDKVYPLAVSGLYDDGQAFSFNASVQVASVA